MILDRLDRAEAYYSLHPGIARAVEWVRNTDLASLSDGKHTIDGTRLFVVINRGPGKGRSGAVLEAHEKYIDLQLSLSGVDEIGWQAKRDCHEVTIPYSAEKDIAFYGDAVESWVAVPPGTFVIFFPEDAHAPMGGTGDLVKAVVKIAVEW